MIDQVLSYYKTAFVHGLKTDVRANRLSLLRTQRRYRVRALQIVLYRAIFHTRVRDVSHAVNTVRWRY